MPGNFCNSTCRSIFAEKMEYNIKKEQAVEMCQSFVSVVTGKCIEKAAEQGERVDVSVIQPHLAELSRHISIRFTKDGDANINIAPLKKDSSSGNNLWQFLEEYLPDYYHRDDVLHLDIYCITQMIPNSILSAQYLMKHYYFYQIKKSFSRSIICLQ